MSIPKIWEKVTPNRPCPKCGHGNRCLIAPDGGAGWCWRKDGGKEWHAERPTASAPAETSPARRGKSFAALDEAIEEARPADYGLAVTYKYPDGFRVARFENDDTDKQFRPLHRDANGRWRIGDPAGKLPLYQRDKLRAGMVWVAEGEKACLAARKIGLNCTTSAHGSSSAAKTDWTPLAGRNVVILPDNDDAGRKYARDVATLLARLETPAMAKIVALPGLPEQGDIVEFIKARPGAKREDIRHDIKALARAVPFIDPTELIGGCVLERLSDFKDEPLRWLWPDRIPLDDITIIGGHPGVGKGRVLADIIAHVTTGRNWPDGRSCAKGSALIIDVEDKPGRDIRARVLAQGGDPERVSVIRTVKRPDKDGKIEEDIFALRNVDALDRAMKGIRDLRIVAIDPIGDFIGGKTDTSRDNEVRSVLRPIVRLAEKHGVAVVIVMHRRKAGASRADETMLGTVGFTGLPRAVWHVSADAANKERRLFLAGKNNLARTSEGGLAFGITGNPPAVVWEAGPVMMTADEAVATEAGNDGPGRPATEFAEARSWLENILADGKPHAVEEVKQAMDGAGLSASWRTIRRAKADLHVKVERDGFNGPWSWQLHSGQPSGQNSPGQIILATGQNAENRDIPAKFIHSGHNSNIEGKAGKNGFPSRTLEERQQDVLDRAELMITRR